MKHNYFIFTGVCEYQIADPAGLITACLSGRGWLPSALQPGCRWIMLHYECIIHKLTICDRLSFILLLSLFLDYLWDSWVKIYLQDINGDFCLLRKWATRCSGMNAVCRAFDSSCKATVQLPHWRILLKYRNNRNILSSSLVSCQ